MDNLDLITKSNNNIGNLAVDGLVNGLISGILMYLSLVIAGLAARVPSGNLLTWFSAGEVTTPFQGMLSHLTVSVIYGMVFGVLFWPLLMRFPSITLIGWFGGFAYGALLLLLAQSAVLPGTDSPLGQLPLWILAAGHAVYGLALGGLFARGTRLRSI